ncbi:MAG: GAF domain-containing protein, partial [Chloroflexota bacterium]
VVSTGQSLEAATQVNSFTNIVFILFSAATLYVFWRFRARMGSVSLRTGIALFLIGQTVGYLNPQQQNLSIAIILTSIATLLISISILRQEIITPLKERTSQVEAMHRMSIAITSQLSPEVILDRIASQTAARLDADGVGVFLTSEDGVRLSAVDGLPEKLVDTVIPSGGIVEYVVESQAAVHYDDYRTQWHGVDDLPFASLSFGALLCVPLLYGESAIGAILAVVGNRRPSFIEDDKRLLEMLAAQAAVAIQHAQLFTQQQVLTDEIAAARSQLETLLTSTENPVIAVDKNLMRIFTNAAADRLFPPLQHSLQPISEILPPDTLPNTPIKVYRDIIRNRVHVYEIVLQDRVYLAHLAALE